ncbi:MAG: YbdK family carboxylate-amine ligase [Acidimicrobiia bacterium]|nr:YbdK family carboxylate-amine ligase [Acidimicrobiia bacterium]
MIRFEGSGAHRIGMEMEFQLVDGTTWDLVNGLLPLLELFPDSEFVKPEFIQNSVEIASPPCADIASLGTELTRLVAALDRSCRRLGYRLCSAGTHPFSLEAASITPLPRYLALGKSGGYLGPNQICFATHVHVDVASGDEAVQLMAQLKPYLPLLIALSANSPYWRAEDTRFAAFRHHILAASRNYGLPPDFATWQDFEDFFDIMRRAGRISGVNDIHWDIRPRPHLGTLEMRVMDAQTRIGDALALAAFVRGLVQLLRAAGPGGEVPAAGLPAALPWWAHRDNCFVASRDGLDALLIADERGRVERVTDMIDAALDAVEPHSVRLGDVGHLAALRSTLRNGGPYAEQRRLHDEHGSLASVVEALADDLVALPG